MQGVLQPTQGRKIVTMRIKCMSFNCWNIDFAPSSFCLAWPIASVTYAADESSGDAQFGLFSTITFAEHCAYHDRYRVWNDT